MIFGRNLSLGKRALICSCFVLLFIFLWLFANIDSWERRGFNHRIKGIGALFGITGYSFFSLSLFLSSRWKKIENWFGGLDQIYHLHRFIGIWGFVFILVHPLIMASKWLPQHMDRFLLFLFPIHERVSMNLGSYSFWLMVIILGITLFKLLPYDKWKSTHKFMSLVFILASLHFIFSDKLFGAQIDKALLCIPLTLGIASITYKQIIYPFFIDCPQYEVVKTNKLNYNTIEVMFSPIKGKITFIPGQYAFFTFQGKKLSNESHPFTLCGDPKGSQISILVKARGDYTKRLYQYVQMGYKASLEGPYGRFDYTKGKDSQVWIAGGIGIVPFVIWSKLAKKIPVNVDLFYCVRKKEDAIFLDLFHQMQSTQYNFFFFCSEENNRINAKKVQQKIGQLQNRSIFLCGPKRLTTDLTEQFCSLGIKRKDLIFEDFEFL